MADNPPRDPVPAPTGANVPSTPQASVLDANGFDPTEFEWRPVPRRPRKDGWTPEVQARFIEALARTGVVERACEEVGMSVRSAYTLRHAAGAEDFARAWATVLTRAADRLLDIAFEQAIEGEEVPIFDADGVRTGAKRKYNTRMAIFLLKAYHPERFRHADKEVRRADEVPPPVAIPVAAAIASLQPVTPAEPHLLSPPDQLQPQILRARDEGERLAASPPDETERYRREPVPANHPRVSERSARNRSRRQRREDREDKRHGNTWADAEHARLDQEDAAHAKASTRWPPDHTDWLKQNGGE